MKKNRAVAILFVIVFLSFFTGGVVVNYFPEIKLFLKAKIVNWDDENRGKWSSDFSIVEIKSSIDGSLQPAYFFASDTGIKKPFVVSLHTWSGDYSQNDPLSSMVKNEGWNYIHPDFRGPNSNKKACLSEQAVSDIDDAIQYGIENGLVDEENIFIVGASGGGYATLGAYLKTKYKIKAFLSWVPISDLTAWFYQSKSMNSKYWNDILGCTSSGSELDKIAARKKSPLFMDIPIKQNGLLEIYAGINDGHKGSVPISHSILFFNRIAMHYGTSKDLIGQEDIVKLLTRETVNGTDKFIDGRKVLYNKNSENMTLQIFDGGHEMLPKYTFTRLKEISELDF